MNWGYKPPAWLLGEHVQTIYPAIIASKIYPKQVWQRQRILTDDQDFIDLDWSSGARQQSTLCVLFHGLEGSSSSHYSVAFSSHMQTVGVGICIPHFRGCSGEINHGPRAYHSGDYEEIDWILENIKTQFLGEIWAVGVSLGGNALLRWAQERGDSAQKIVKGVASICAPLDLSQSGKKIGLGVNHYLYERRFLKTMKHKAREKIKQYPGLFNYQNVERSQSLFDFDNHFTAPLHGFKNTEEYWRICSAKPHMKNIKLPHLVVNALNDPFIPPESLPNREEFNNLGIQINTKYGGHVGFAYAPNSGNLNPLPTLISSWMKS